MAVNKQISLPRCWAYDILSSHGRASTPGQTQAGVGPRVCPFTIIGWCVARIRWWQ